MSYNDVFDKIFAEIYTRPPESQIVAWKSNVSSFNIDWYYERYWETHYSHSVTKEKEPIATALYMQNCDLHEFRSVKVTIHLINIMRTINIVDGLQTWKVDYIKKGSKRKEVTASKAAFIFISDHYSDKNSYKYLHCHLWATDNVKISLEHYRFNQRHQVHYKCPTVVKII